MIEAEEPWGFIVTRTLHVVEWERGDPRPACGNQQVQATADGIRYRWSVEPDFTDPIFGSADGRPVCKHCIEADHMRETFYAERAALSAAHNAGRTRKENP